MRRLPFPLVLLLVLAPVFLAACGDEPEEPALPLAGRAPVQGEALQLHGFIAALDSGMAALDRDLAAFERQTASTDSVARPALAERLARLHAERDSLQYDLLGVRGTLESASRDVRRRLNVRLSTLQGELALARLQTAASQEAFLRTVDELMRDTDAALAGLDARVGAAEAEARRDYRQQLDSLRSWRTTVAGRLQGIRAAGTSPGDEIARDVAELYATTRAARYHMAYLPTANPAPSTSNASSAR